jgi:hypothetical protein
MIQSLAAFPMPTLKTFNKEELARYMSLDPDEQVRLATEILSEGSVREDLRDTKATVAHINGKAKDALTKLREMKSSAGWKNIPKDAKADILFAIKQMSEICE